MAAMTEPEVRPIYSFYEIMSFDGTPEDPYGGHAHSGQKRKRILIAFMQGEDLPGIEVWRVTDHPADNKRITDPRLVVWPYEYRQEAGLT